MALRGALMPLDELMPTLGVSDDEMTKAWDYNVWRGKRWAIPRSDNPTIMLYNRSMVAEAGMDDPAELWAEGKWDIEAFDNTMDAVSGGEGLDRVTVAPCPAAARSACSASGSGATTPRSGMRTRPRLPSTAPKRSKPGST